MTFGFAAAAGCCRGQAQETAGRLHRLASAIKVETFLFARASITEGRRAGFSSYWLQTFAHSILAHLLFCICLLPGRKRRMAADNDGSVLLTNRHVKPEARRLDWICLFLPSFLPISPLLPFVWALGCMGYWVPVHLLAQCPHKHTHTQREPHHKELDSRDDKCRRDSRRALQHRNLLSLGMAPSSFLTALLLLRFQREREREWVSLFLLFLFRFFHAPGRQGQ